jgi:hypothetical protein
MGTALAGLLGHGGVGVGVGVGIDDVGLLRKVTGREKIQRGLGVGETVLKPADVSDGDASVEP